MPKLACNRRLLIIFNPTAGGCRRRRLEAVLAGLRGFGCAITLRQTTAPGDARRLAASADPNRYDVLVVAGGDGTINEAVDGLNGAGLPLAIVPLGTANVLAAEIGMTIDPASIARTIAQGQPRPISLGMANGRRFVLMAGTGFDAHVVQHLDLALKRRIGKGAYAISILRQLFAFDFPEYVVKIEGRTWKVASVLVANGRYYGGRFVCAPKADLASPTLEVCMFRHRGPLSAIGYAMAMFTGRLPKWRSYQIVSCARVEIGGGGDEPVMADGDIIGRLDVTIEVIPNAINLVYPPGPDAAGARQAAGRERQWASNSTLPASRACSRTGTSQLPACHAKATPHAEVVAQHVVAFVVIRRPQEIQHLLARALPRSDHGQRYEERNHRDQPVR